MSVMVPVPGCAPIAPQHVALMAVPKEGRATVRLLGPCVGILTHWSKKRPIACPGANACPSLVHRLSTVWKGYCAAEVWRDTPERVWYPTVLEITERLWEVMSPHQLRGTVWELFRTVGDHGRIEVSGRLLDLVDPRTLRDDVRIEPVVSRVYRTMEIGWGATPVLPPRQLLAPVADAAPPTASAALPPEQIPGTPEWEAERAKAKAAIQAALKSARGTNGKGGVG